MHIMWSFLLLIGLQGILGQQQGGNKDVTQSIIESCKMEALCIGEPKDCFQDSHTKCNMMVAITKKGDKYYFDLFGKQHSATGGQGSGSSGEFIAVGISTTGSTLINASIVECSQHDQIKVRFGSNGNFHDVTNQAKYVEHADGYTPGAYNGKIVCNFTRLAESQEHKVKFNLNKEKYYISLIHGIEHENEWHDVSNHTTNERMYLSKPLMANKGHLMMLGVDVLSFVITLFAVECLVWYGIY